MNNNDPKRLKRLLSRTGMDWDEYYETAYMNIIEASSMISNKRMEEATRRSFKFCLRYGIMMGVKVIMKNSIDILSMYGLDAIEVIKSANDGVLEPTFKKYITELAEDGTNWTEHVEGTANYDANWIEETANGQMMVIQPKQTSESVIIKDLLTIALRRGGRTGMQHASEAIISYLDDSIVEEKISTMSDSELSKVT